MLEVAVIGAGASALAASRHLIGQGLRPSIFEAAKTLGGAWAVSDSSSSSTMGISSSSNTKMWNGLTTNLSKHTCRFSEWPWPDDAATFPSAVDMGRYLEGYADHFLDPSCFQYQCEVTNIESLSESGSNHHPGYRVEWTDLSTSTKHSKDFEGVVVATGFFSKPHLPKGVVNDYRTNPQIQNYLLHASEYESSAAFADQTVVVVGGSFSALEIAVDVATTAKRVVHVLPSERIPWVLPRYVPHLYKNAEDNNVQASSKIVTSILPVDLALYRRNQDAPQLPETIQMTTEMSNARHEYMYSMVGKRQEASPLGIPNNWDEPPLVAISDYYLDMIVQRDIEVVHGRFEGLAATTTTGSNDGNGNNEENEHTKPTWQIESPTGQPIYLRDIDKVICATGYESNLQEYLHPDILKTLEYDQNDLFCPMSSCWDTLHPELPNLFFCGMYRGPYMGIMELQGRVAAGILSGNVELEQSTIDHALEQSRQIRTQQPRPQFPHFDYLGFMDTLTKDALQSTADFPKMNLQKGDMVSPAFYQSTDDQLAVDEANELEQHVACGQDGSRIPSVVLSSIIGEWNFDRRIVHFDDGRQEHVYGAVRYSRPALDHVLYREDGFYELSSTKTLNVFREYEYQVTGDCLELYFVEQGERADLFLSLKFSKQEGRDHWVATSDHLCIKDLYKARFEIWLDGLAATHLQITYRVKGPTKDYESTTILTPKTTKTPIGVM
jgi:lysine/ornithine N-monooxygenase